MIWCAWWPFFVSFFGQTKKEKLKVIGLNLGNYFQMKIILSGSSEKNKCLISIETP